jgi:beta-barrel assembly-enhancing protease
MRGMIAVKASLLAMALSVVGHSALAQLPSRPLSPSTVNYQPMDDDERSLWMQMAEVEGKMKESDFLIKDPKLNAYIRSILCRSVGQERCASSRVYLLRTPHFNAAMAPNGMMMVWSGLLLRAQNEAELASVLAHEFSHFEHRHSLQSLRNIRAKSEAFTWLSMVPAIGMIGQIDLIGSVLRLAATWKDKPICRH